MAGNEKKIAFIHPFQLRLQRGIEVYLWNIASNLILQDCRVDILTWDGPLGIPDYIDQNKIKLSKVPSVRYFQAIFAIPFYIFWLIIGKYDHVFVHFAGYGEGPSIQIARIFSKFPFSIVFHFPYSLVPHRYREFELWKFQRDAKHLIGVSQSTASEVEKWSGRKCVVIEHGVDVDRFRPDHNLGKTIRQGLGIEESSLVLISVAAFEQRKGIQSVIRAMPELLLRKYVVHFLVIGDGPYASELHKLTNAYHLQGNIHFLGIQIDVRPFLCAADIVMTLSKGEASSITLLEGLACELPGITSRHPPFDELIRDQFGLMVDEENPSEVAAAIISIAKDKNNRMRMGKEARIWVKNNHSWLQAALEYKKIICD